MNMLSYSEVTALFFYRKDRDKELQVVFTLYRIGLIGKKKCEYYIRKE